MAEDGDWLVGTELASQGTGPLDEATLTAQASPLPFLAPPEPDDSLFGDFNNVLKVCDLFFYASTSRSADPQSAPDQAWPEYAPVTQVQPVAQHR